MAYLCNSGTPNVWAILGYSKFKAILCYMRSCLKKWKGEREGQGEKKKLGYRGYSEYMRNTDLETIFLLVYCFVISLSSPFSNPAFHNPSLVLCRVM